MRLNKPERRRGRCRDERPGCHRGKGPARRSGIDDSAAPAGSRLRRRPGRWKLASLPLPLPRCLAAEGPSRHGTGFCRRTCPSCAESGRSALAVRARAPKLDPYRLLPGRPWWVGVDEPHGLSGRSDLSRRPLGPQPSIARRLCVLPCPPPSLRLHALDGIGRCRHRTTSSVPRRYYVGAPASLTAEPPQ